MQKQNIDFSNWLIFFCFFYKIEGVPVSSVICTVMLFSLKQSPPSFRDKQVVTWNSYVPRICIFLWKIFIDKDKNKNINLKSWIVNVTWIIFSFLVRFGDLMIKNTKAIQCDLCKYWVHIECNHLVKWLMIQTMFWILSITA